MTDGRVVIDLRASAVRHGWRLDATTPGWIPGSVHLDARWCDTLEDAVLHQCLRRIRVEPNARYALQGSDAQIESVARLLSGLGHRDLARVVDGRDSGRPARRRLPHFEKLIPVEALAAVRAAGAHRFFDVNARRDGPGPHIEGARALAVEDFEDGPFWNRRPFAELTEVLRAHGVDRDARVILSGPNQMMTARVAHLMIYAGVRDVRLVDGGNVAWTWAGRALTDAREAPYARVAEFGTARPARPELAVDLDAVPTFGLGLGDKRLVSIRSWPEHTGLTSGYAHVRRRGEIPGAIWGRGGSDADHLEDYRNPDHSMIDGELIEAHWRTAGLERQNDICLYCGTGWRASEVFFYAQILGWPRVRVFGGGWKEYSERRLAGIEPSRAVEDVRT